MKSWKGFQNDGGIKMSAKKIETIEDLPGVGATTAEKLRAAGYTNLEAIAVASPMELSEIAALGDATAVKAINAARDALEMGYESADKILEKRNQIKKLTVPSEAFNVLLGGGLETQSITEAYGQYGSGKSQLAHQLAVSVQVPLEEGGLGGNCLFIDTENTFRPERIKQMAEARGMDPDEVLKNIIVGRAYNSDHQMLLLEKAKDLIKEKNIKLIVVDSLTAHFRAEYTGRGKLAERQQKLNRHMHTLQRVADVNDLVIFVTNQVMSRPDVMFGDPTAAIGGHVVAHTATYRLYLRRSKAEKRIAKLVDSPNLPDGEVVFRVTSNGIEDE
ncbi:MAG: DNA repair and recombination protein RadA [Candidatus Diapherotrites archaeon]|nr:DNA repair and recombination protein RadA [Candidatus Diapherotrites archaeon]